MFQLSDIIIIAVVVIAAILAGLIYLSRKNYKQLIRSQDFIEQNKTKVQIFVIDKKYEKPTEHNMNKKVFEQLPKTTKMRKLPLVKAKVGPQIVTLMCDKQLYEVMPVKKNVKVELAGIYIVNIVGMNLADKKKKTWKDKLSLATQNSLEKK